MRCVFFVVFLSLFCPSARCQVVINEIYYDHPGRDDGHEFVELVSVSNKAQDLTGYALEFHDGAGSGWTLLWTASPFDSVGAGALRVIGGALVSPPPDDIVALGLQNGPDAVRLVRDGVEIDRVGYGNLLIGLYFENDPAPDVAEGWSLSRYPDGRDTDVNAEDFEARLPSPGTYNQPRTDVAMRLSERTPLRRVLDQPGTQDVFAYIVNYGQKLIVAESVTVSLEDSLDVAAPVQNTNPSPIAPGDSIEISFSIMLDEGPHVLAVTATLDGDERADNDRLLLWRRVGEPGLLISEVMSLPRPGCPEYIEVFNSGAEPYSLDHHSIRDAAHDPVGVVSGRLIPPGGYAVITNDGRAMQACFSAMDTLLLFEVAGTWPSLNHSGSGSVADSVVVLDAFKLPVDPIGYPPQSRNTEGRSLERIDLYPGLRTHAWFLSSDSGGGSPGRAHARAIYDIPQDQGMTLEPNPFDLQGGQPLLIRVPASSEPVRAHVQIFDIRGREVFDVGQSSVLPYVFTWGGFDGEGHRVAPGIYLVTCKRFGLTSGRRVVEKVVLGCGKTSH